MIEMYRDAGLQGKAAIRLQQQTRAQASCACVKKVGEEKDERMFTQKK